MVDFGEPRLLLEAVVREEPRSTEGNSADQPSLFGD